MTGDIVRLSAVLFFLGAAALGQLPDDDRAVLVVTGLRLEGKPPAETRDLTVAEGAVVKLVAKGGAPQTKTTAPFERAGRRFFTADFPISLEQSYDIVMTFRDGTVIRVADYRLPRDWRTHLLFHSTRGTKSPASILRKEKDPKSPVYCYVYAVWPHSSYSALGGRQVGPPE
jgi:hypothetical protein